MATSNGIKRRIDEFARQLREEFGAVDDSGDDCWLTVVEDLAIEVGDAVAVALVERQALDRSIHEESACPQCGQLGRYRGHRKRPLVTRRGAATIREPEYYCPCCRKAFFPDDRRVGR